MAGPDNTAFVNSSIAYLKRIESDEQALAPAGTFLSLAAGDDDTIPVQLFSYEVAAFYVYDDGNTFTYVTDAMREEVGLTREQLHDIGLANLAQRFGGMELHQGGGMLVLTGDGNFEASMILLDTVWDQLAHHFPNGPIAALPARDVIGLCDAQDNTAVNRLRVTAQKLWDEDADHLLAKDLYRRDANSIWVPVQ